MVERKQTRRVQWVHQLQMCGEWIDETVFDDQPLKPDFEGWTPPPAEKKALDLFEAQVQNWPDLKHRLIRRIVTEETLDSHTRTRKYTPPKLIVG